jgi:hypothetical protein
MNYSLYPRAFKSITEIQKKKDNFYNTNIRVKSDKRFNTFSLLITLIKV